MKKPTGRGGISLKTLKMLVHAKQMIALKTLKMSDTEEIAVWIEEQLRPEFTRYEWLQRTDWIKRAITNAIELNDFDGPTDLFNDFDYPFTIRDHGRSRQVLLGRLKLPDIAKIRQQKAANLAAAGDALDRFDRARRLIEPLLRDNPTWDWETAVESLRGLKAAE